MKQIPINLEKLASSMKNVEKNMEMVYESYLNEKYPDGEGKWTRIEKSITGYVHHLSGHLSLPYGCRIQPVFDIQGQVRAIQERYNSNNKLITLNEHFVTCGTIYRMNLSEERNCLDILRWNLSEYYAHQNVASDKDEEIVYKAYFLNKIKRTTLIRRDELIKSLIEVKRYSPLLNAMPINIHPSYEAAKKNRDVPWFTYDQILTQKE